MAKKKRQRISYVLPLASRPGGHRLGVNGLSFDHDRNILYTGGRDGVICAWDINHNALYEEQPDKTFPPKRTTASFRKQVQAHTHWVNDLVLVKNNLAVVSASSDASVKLWRPHSHEATTAYSIGSHSDYVKCLTSPDRTANWVASSGLDSRIKLWDLAGGGQTLEINVKQEEDIVKGSIYALKARGSIMASGGPEGVVRLWDVKSGKSITKLVGHTDMVRDILISDDGDTVLTASSDQTIKVWSITAGRCQNTLTMHNDSVWSLYSDVPSLSVFYSGDKSGLVAKTDTRRAQEEIEEGVSVAVCQEHDGIVRLEVAGDSVWTATSSSSINRWKDVDTELEVETPPQSPRVERQSSPLSQNVDPLNNSASDSTKEQSTNTDNRIPHNAILLLSHTAPHPGRKGAPRSYSITNLRKPSEAVLDQHISYTVPFRGHPEETIEGQNGLTKHRMLSDKKRVLTIDTAGEVVMWDLLKCISIQSFGRKHIDDVLTDVDTTEAVLNWCTVDTKTGKLTITLEENYAFDAEVYADEIDIPEKIDFKEDQRINLGKWVLRNLFTTLLEEEIKRDEDYRRSLKVNVPSVNQSGIQRLGAPTSIILPTSQGATPLVSPGTTITPRANGTTYPQTPGLAIGLATPGIIPASTHNPISPSNLATTLETPELERKTTRPGQPALTLETPSDYFSSPVTRTETATESNVQSPGPQNNLPLMTPTSPAEDRKKGMLFGKKFGMTFPKKLGRASSEVTKNPATSEEKAEESDRSSEKDEPVVKVYDDNFHGVIQRIREKYDEHVQMGSEIKIPLGIISSPPSETPILKPPPHTLIIIQEDDPESGGLTDLYRGEISELGKDADTLEKIAPTWLGDLLLRNEQPPKEASKVSFILLPFENLLPHISPPTEPNARLNANRMLRAKKIIAYICERIEAPEPPPPITQPTAAGAESTTNGDSTAPTEESKVDSDDQPTQTSTASPTTATTTVSRLRPEEYMDLLCHGQPVDPNMTLATLRTHVWRAGGDIVLYYRANGKKVIRIPHPADVAGRDEGMGTQVTSATVTNNTTTV